MSKADEMFEYLEYDKKETRKIIEYYQHFGWLIPDASITFYKETKRVNVNFNFDMQELQAINEKIKELGWNV